MAVPVLNCVQPGMCVRTLCSGSVNNRVFILFKSTVVGLGNVVCDDDVTLTSSPHTLWTIVLDYD